MAAPAQVVKHLDNDAPLLVATLHELERAGIWVRVIGWPWWELRDTAKGPVDPAHVHREPA